MNFQVTPPSYSSGKRMGIDTLRLRTDTKFVNINKPLWVKHPKADVAAMFIVPPKDNDINLVPATLLSTDQLLEDYDIYPGREIKVLGFPLWHGI